ncbi:MAG: S24 family peptidase [Bacteroidota bacterium]
MEQVEQTTQQALLTMPNSKSNKFILEVKGDSMAPTIRESDIIIVDPDAEPLPGDVCLIRIEGLGYTLKRVHFDMDEVILTSDNPVYKKKIFPAAEVIQIYPVIMHIKKHEQIRKKYMI